MNDEIEYLRKVYQSEETSTWVNKLQMKSIVDYADELQSNWNSLREWLEALKNYEETKDKMFYIGSIQVLQDVLDKMNELEGKSNDN